MKSHLISILKGEKSLITPVWYMRQAGRYLPEYLKLREQEQDFIRFCLTPKLSVEASLQPLRRFDLDAAILFADILLIPYVLGQQVRFEKNRGPVLSPFSLEQLDSTKLKNLSPVYQTLKDIRLKLDPDKALIGFSGAAWTLACYMVAGRAEPQQETTKAFLFRSPEIFSKLINILIEAISDYCIAQIAAGAEVIQLFDSWAGVLPAEQFHTYVIQPTRKIVQKISSIYPDIPIIGFAKNAGILTEHYAKETSINAISVDSTLPLDWIAEHLQKYIPVQGNLDPILAVVGGQAMLSATEKIFHHLGQGAFIFNLGHGILPQTPPEHIATLTQYAHSFTR